jgi:hypothetical protein
MDSTTESFLKEIENLLFEVIRNSLGIAFELTRLSADGEIPRQHNLRVERMLRGFGDRKRMGSHTDFLFLPVISNEGDPTKNQMELTHLLSVLRLGNEYLDSKSSQDLLRVLEQMDTMTYLELRQKASQYLPDADSMAHGNLKRALHKHMLKLREAQLLQHNCVWNAMETALQLLYRHVEIYTASNEASHSARPEFRRQCAEKIPPKLAKLRTLLLASLSFPASSPYESFSGKRDRDTFESSALVPFQNSQAQTLHLLSLERVQGADKTKLRER